MVMGLIPEGDIINKDFAGGQKLKKKLLFSLSHLVKILF